MDKWMTVKDVAGYLQVSEESIYKLAQRQRIPASKILSQWRFDLKEVDIWVRKQRMGKRKIS